MGQFLQRAVLVAGGQPNAGEEFVVKRDFFGPKESTLSAQTCGEAAADGHRVAVAPRVVVRSLDRVGEGVTIVEDLAQSAFGQVGGDDAGLDCDRTGSDLGQLLAGGVKEDLRGGLPHDAQDLRVGDEPTLDDLGGPRRQVLAGQGCQQAHVGDDRVGRVEGADQIFAHRCVDTGFAAHGCVNHAEQRGRHVDERHAAQPRGGDEARHVCGRSPAHGNDYILAAQLEVPAGVPQAGHDLDGLSGLGVRMVGGGYLVAEGTEVLGERHCACSERARVDDEDLHDGLVERGGDGSKSQVTADGDS